MQSVFGKCSLYGFELLQVFKDELCYIATARFLLLIDVRALDRVLREDNCSMRKAERFEVDQAAAALNDIFQLLSLSFYEGEGLFEKERDVSYGALCVFPQEGENCCHAEARVAGLYM